MNGTIELKRAESLEISSTINREGRIYIGEELLEKWKSDKIYISVSNTGDILLTANEYSGDITKYWVAKKESAITINTKAVKASNIKFGIFKKRKIRIVEIIEGYVLKVETLRRFF